MSAPIADPNLTQLLKRWREGDANAFQRLIDLAYPKLRALASRHLSGGGAVTLDTTDLVHEAYLKLVRQQRMDWQNEAHLLAIVARVMRRVVVDHVRRRKRIKRGGGRVQVSLEKVGGEVDRAVDWQYLDRCLEELGAIDERAERVVELRYFSGMTLEQVAEALGVSRSTAVRSWRFARAWLSQRLEDGG